MSPSVIAAIAIAVLVSVLVGWFVDRNTGLATLAVLLVLVALAVADPHDTLLR